MCCYSLTNKTSLCHSLSFVINISTTFTFFLVITMFHKLHIHTTNSIMTIDYIECNNWLLYVHPLNSSYYICKTNSATTHISSIETNYLSRPTYSLLINYIERKSLISESLRQIHPTQHSIN